MSLELLELAAAALTDLLPEVVFLGGATVALWITDPGAPPVRPTKDVDVIVQVTTRSGLILDAMPADGTLLGFENRWQGAAIPHAMACALPSRAIIRAVSPPYLLATKIEAFKSRGSGDLLGSRDFGDVIAVVDGREELVDEVAAAADDVRRYLAEEIDTLLSAPRFLDGLFGALRGDPASQDRADAVVLPALRAIASAR